MGETGGSGPRFTTLHERSVAVPMRDGTIPRARYRRSFTAPGPLTPGSIERHEIDPWAASNAFPPGHRPRVSVTSRCFPRFDRNLNTGGPIH